MSHSIHMLSIQTDTKLSFLKGFRDVRLLDTLQCCVLFNHLEWEILHFHGIFLLLMYSYGRAQSISSVLVEPGSYPIGSYRNMGDGKTVLDIPCLTAWRNTGTKRKVNTWASDVIHIMQSYAQCLKIAQKVPFFQNIIFQFLVFSRNFCTINYCHVW